MSLTRTDPRVLQSAPKPTKQQIFRSRCTLVALFVCFLLPVVLAYLALSTQWYESRGLTNKGSLLNPTLNLNEVVPILDATLNPSQPLTGWQLLYLLPKQCDSVCEQRLIQIRQTLTALGPERKRVSALLIGSGAVDHKVKQWLAAQADQFRDIQLVQLSAQGYNKAQLNLETTAAEAGEKHLYVVDPQNRMILSYPAEIDASDWIQGGKAVLKDLKRLLKVSRIG